MLIIIGFQGQVIQRKLCLLYLVLMDVTKLDRDLVFVLFFVMALRTEALSILLLKKIVYYAL